MSSEAAVTGHAARNTSPAHQAALFANSSKTSLFSQTLFLMKCDKQQAGTTKCSALLQKYMSVAFTSVGFLLQRCQVR
jgi:hypothetical protein